LDVAKSHTFFGRAEWVDKDELFCLTPAGGSDLRVGKLSLGYVYDFATASHFKFGIGGLASRYSLPSDLVPVYGHPTSYMLFARVKIQ
jgi:hypothetical protein